MAGAKRAGMAATAKHFPTHAGARSDSHTDVAVDRRELAELDDDLLPYRELIRNDLPAVMIAHVSFPAVDETPASLSSWWIGTQLREALGFTGAVITDDVSMAGAAAGGTVDGRARRALRRGLRPRAALQLSGRRCRALLDALDGYVNPAAALRLTRLHGRGGVTWDVLHDSAEWRKAHAAIEALCARPALELRAESDARERRCRRCARRAAHARRVRARARSRGRSQRMADEITADLAGADPVVLAVDARRCVRGRRDLPTTALPVRARLRARDALRARHARRRDRMASAAERRAYEPHRARRSTTCSTAVTRCALSAPSCKRVGVARQLHRGARREKSRECARQAEGRLPRRRGRRRLFVRLRHGLSRLLARVAGALCARFDEALARARNASVCGRVAPGCDALHSRFARLSRA